MPPGPLHLQRLTPVTCSPCHLPPVTPHACACPPAPCPQCLPHNLPPLLPPPLLDGSSGSSSQVREAGAGTRGKQLHGHPCTPPHTLPLPASHSPFPSHSLHCMSPPCHTSHPGLGLLAAQLWLWPWAQGCSWCGATAYPRLAFKSKTRLPSLVDWEQRKTSSWVWVNVVNEVNSRPQY